MTGPLRWGVWRRRPRQSKMAADVRAPARMLSAYVARSSNTMARTRWQRGVLPVDAVAGSTLTAITTIAVYVCNV